MAQLAHQKRDPASAELADLPPDRVPDTATAIDRGHLARMTFGDRGLERELLQLFDRQSAVLIVRMRAGGAAAIAPLAHLLKGSASGIGAERVMRAAEAAELAAAAGAGESELAVSRLAGAVDEARAAIAELLGNDNEGIARVPE